MKTPILLFLAAIVLVAVSCTSPRETGHTFLLRHTSADDLIPIVASCLERPSSVQATPDGKGIVVTAPPSVLAQIEKLVAEVDTPPRSIAIEGEPFATPEDIEELGLKWILLDKQSNNAEQKN